MFPLLLFLVLRNCLNSNFILNEALFQKHVSNWFYTNFNFVFFKIQSLLPHPVQSVTEGVTADCDAICHPCIAPWRCGRKEQAETHHWGFGLGYHAFIQLQTVSIDMSFFFNCWQTFSFCAFLSLIMPWVHIILEGMKTGSLSTRVLLILTSYSKTLVWSEQADFCKSSAAYRHHKHSNKCAAVPEQKWHVQKLIAVSKAG